MPEMEMNPLLTEGLKSYPQALIAIKHFRQLVLNACREAFIAELGNISNAMGVRLEKLRVEARRRPDDINGNGVDGMNADIGVRIKHEQEGWNLYHNVAWSQGEIGAWISIWTRERISSDRIYAALNPIYKREFQLTAPKDNEVEVCLGKLIDTEHEVDLPMALRELIAEWVRIWNGVGGLNKILGGS